MSARSLNARLCSLWSKGKVKKMVKTACEWPTSPSPDDPVGPMGDLVHGVLARLSSFSTLLLLFLPPHSLPVLSGVLAYKF